MNNSSTGGIVTPNPKAPELVTVPPDLTLVQFIQRLLVGLSELPGPLVIPDWQPEPPKQPDLKVNWLAFGIGEITPDANAFQGVQNGTVDLQRQELIEIQLSVYGPAALDNITLIRDGLQIPQNSAALLRANMGFAYDAPAMHLPDFVNERWIDRFVTKIYLRRYVQRTYPILDFISANGTIFSQTAETTDYSKNWQAGGT